MAITFRIIENPKPIWADFIEEFSEDYNKYEYTTKQLREKYGLSYREYYSLRDTAEEKGLIRKDKYYSPQPPKHYFYSEPKKAYIVSKYAHGRTMYFSSFKSEWEAEFCVKELKKCGWDKSEVPRIKQTIKEMRK